MQNVKITTVKERIKKLLIENKEMRDNDQKLIIAVWKQDLENAGLNTDSMTADKFFTIFVYQEYLTHYESIRRCRQKLQEDYPTLRGDKWYARNVNQDNIQLQLGYC